MDAKELRIGSLVLNVMDRPIIVGLLQIQYARDFIPIPLTEEWLIKFGFEKAINGYWDEDEEFSVLYNYFRMGTLDLCKLKYVHQLQNLYFALTGEELTIK